MPSRFNARELIGGANRFLGFGLSMAVLAAGSLIAIPSMVAASGPHAWGMIASGQALGAVAAVAVAWGWGMSGPAVIARAGERERLSEYASSMVCRLVIAPPICAAAFGLAWLIAGRHGLVAGVGALSTATVGLTANWYFVGLARPYALLFGETVPRIGGTIVGIVLMRTGSSALIGVLWQLIGMLAAFVVCSVWILAPWDSARRSLITVRPVRATLWGQRNGFAATILSAVYSALPITLVTLFAPGLQPEYAVLDKVQRQVNAGLAPFTVVMQGWIPRGAGRALGGRIRSGLALSLASAAALAAVMIAISRELIDWLGGGAIVPSWQATAVMVAITGVYLFEQTVSKAALPALGLVGVAARATLIGMVVGLLLVVAGLLAWGVVGALLGVLSGIVVRAAIGLVALSRTPAQAAAANTSEPVEIVRNAA
jgi:hypothetical protein